MKLSNRYISCTKIGNVGWNMERSEGDWNPRVRIDDWMGLCCGVIV